MAFEEINPKIWNYTKDGDFIEGILVRVQDDVGINKSKLYHIENAEGIKSCWGSAILDERMALVKVGEMIRIVYKGLAEAQKGKNPAKIFKVYINKSFNQ